MDRTQLNSGSVVSAREGRGRRAEQGKMGRKREAREDWAGGREQVFKDDSTRSRDQRTENSCGQRKPGCGGRPGFQGAPASTFDGDGWADWSIGVGCRLDNRAQGLQQRHANCDCVRYRTLPTLGRVSMPSSGDIRAISGCWPARADPRCRFLKLPSTPPAPNLRATYVLVHPHARRRLRPRRGPGPWAAATCGKGSVLFSVLCFAAPPDSLWDSRGPTHGHRKDRVARWWSPAPRGGPSPFLGRLSMPFVWAVWAVWPARSVCSDRKKEPWHAQQQGTWGSEGRVTRSSTAPGRLKPFDPPQPDTTRGKAVGERDEVLDAGP